MRRDLNQNGVSEAGELFTLGQMGITRIALQTTDVTGTNAGAELGVTALFTCANGSTGAATSVYFQTDRASTVPNETGFVPAAGVEQLPQLPRSGNLHSTAWVASNNAAFRSANDNWASFRIPPWGSVNPSPLGEWNTILLV
jgi:hypothetical protein